MDDDALGEVTVADVLKNPDAFIEETLADPLEGPSYGPCKARIMLDHNTGGIFINSFAHGGARYRLCYDRAHLEDLLRAADPKHVIDIFMAKDAQSHLEPDDDAALVDLVSKVCGIQKRAVMQKLRQERGRRNRERQAAIEAKRPSSIRPMYRAPESDAELTPTMQLLDDVLGQVAASHPPMRGLSDGRSSRFANRCRLASTCSPAKALTRITAMKKQSPRRRSR